MKKAGELPEALKEHQFKAKDDDEEKEAAEEEDKKEEKEAAVKCETCNCDPCECKEAKVKEEEKEASAKTEFVKWANLDSKNKSFLTKYWRQLFGDDYVNALVSDK